MSAFILPPSHLRAIVGAWASFSGIHAPRWLVLGRQLSIHDVNDWQAAFDALARENALSVAYRYSEEPEPVSGRVTIRDAAMALRTPQQIARIFKAIDSYEYQSCEHPEWEGSEVCAAMRHLRHALWSLLPGYEAAPWVLDGEPNPEDVVALFR